MNEEHIPSEPLVLTVEQIASLLQKKPRTIREMCYKKLIPHIKLGRSIRFDLPKIQEWLENDCHVPMGDGDAA